MLPKLEMFLHCKSIIIQVIEPQKQQKQFLESRVSVYTADAFII